MCIIGIPLKYSHLNDGRPILYLGERIRRTIQKAGGFIIPIVQVQDVFILILGIMNLMNYQRKIKKILINI